MQRAEVHLPSKAIHIFISDVDQLVADVKSSCDILLNLSANRANDTPESQSLQQQINSYVLEQRAQLARLKTTANISKELINRIQKRMFQDEAHDKNRYQSEYESYLEKARSMSDMVGKQIAKLKSDYVAADARYQQMLRAPQGNPEYVNELKALKIITAKLKSDLEAVKSEKAKYDIFFRNIEPAPAEVSELSTKYQRIIDAEVEKLEAVKAGLVNMLQDNVSKHEKYSREIAFESANDRLELLMDSKRHLIEVVDDDEDASPEVKRIIVESAEALAIRPECTQAADQLVKVVQASKKPNSRISALIAGSILAFLGVVTVAVSAALSLTGVAFPFACIGMAVGCAMVFAGILIAGSRSNQYSFFANAAERHASAAGLADHQEAVLAPPVACDG